MITVSAFKWVPPFAQGQVRDLRVRWALEEAGLGYRENLIGLGDNAPGQAYRALQPFGQIPAYEEDGLVLFESGAIALHIAEKSEALLPADAAGRALAITWLFAALNTGGGDPATGEISAFHADKAWAKERRPELEERVRFSAPWPPSWRRSPKTRPPEPARRIRPVL
jgi:glutathione S-transferase